MSCNLRNLLAFLMLGCNLGTATVHAQDNLDGVWEVNSVIDDGHMLSARVIRETLFKDARLSIQGQIILFTAPDGNARMRTFVTDSRSSPKSFDLAGADKVGSKGIYLLDQDNLIICLSGNDSRPRPSAFASREGQDNVLISLQRGKGGAAPSARSSTPPAVIQPPPPPRKNDEEIRKMLVGTWGHQDDSAIQRMTLNPDGTFSATQQFKRGLKKVLDEEGRASGRWAVKDGQVVLTMTANYDARLVGQIFSYTITSLSATEVMYTNNQTGARRVEWRIR